MSKTLINASNLHYGGGVQVAVSILDELNRMGHFNYDIIVSQKVDNELNILKTRLDLFRGYRVYNTYGIRALLDYNFIKLVRSYDVVLTIFGPHYTWGKSKNNIVGFAQPWIIYPNNELYQSFSVVKKLFTKLKYYCQKYFYFKADKIIVELDHVKSELSKFKNSPEIHVVNNCISSIYSDATKWSKVPFSELKDYDILLGIVARDYPHKNLGILPKVKDEMWDVYGVRVKFLVTLTAAEWAERDQEFHKCALNLGSLAITQCPSFYECVDGVIFPSLLECFSATPIEAMIMKKPVFASDRIFVKQACENFVVYFDPKCAKSIAESIFLYFSKNKEKMLNLAENAYDHAQKYNNPAQRAIRFIEIIGSIK